MDAPVQDSSAISDALGDLVGWLVQLRGADPNVWLAVCLGAVAVVLTWVASRRRAAPAPAGDDVDAQVQALIEANRYEVAGDLRMNQGQFQKALALYLNGGCDNKAALCYLQLKEPHKAAEVYRRISRLAEAAHYFQMAGEWREAAECLEHAGSEREAAELYERAGDLSKAAQLLRRLGDADNAARLFERAGHHADAAAALLEARGKEPAVLRRAAELFEQAGESRRAAECYSEAREWPRAGELFDAIGDYSLAAQAFEQAESFDRAAAAYERAGALREARANFERSGDVLRAAQIALKLGYLLAAGRGFYQIGSYERAIETLQSVSPESTHHRSAMVLLGRIFLEKGLLDRAKEKLESLHAEPPTSKEDVEVLSWLADAYERSGEALRAVNLLEQIKDFDPSWSNISERLEHLQERAWGGSSANARPQSERYELRGEVGRGGMGVVHLAQDRELERPVAIKFLPSDLASQPAAVKMFRQEARAAAAMNHPNIVQVYDVTVVDSRPCIVMEYVQGKTARALMKRAGTNARCPLAPRRVAEISRDVCDALAYAHIQNVIHRDVKPGNIIVSDRGQAKLMDFGISKVLEAGIEGQTQAKGTPQYMPPEQILGKEIDGRTDLYALGISMFEIATGRRPFRGDDVVDQQLHVDIPDPRTIHPDIPEELVEIIMKACCKKPFEREQSARDMADALTRFLNRPPA